MSPMPSAPRVLFVDDTADVRQMFATSVLLLRPQWRMDMASGAQEALECYEAARRVGDGYDLIVWDIAMTDHTGLWGARAIRESGDHATRFVVYTGFDRAQNRHAAQDVGALDYIVKASVTPSELLERLEQAMVAEDVAST